MGVAIKRLNKYIIQPHTGYVPMYTYVNEHGLNLPPVDSLGLNFNERRRSSSRIINIIGNSLVLLVSWSFG